MPASPTTKRQQLPRKFEDYVLNYEKSSDAGLFPIPSEKMEYMPGNAGDSGAVDQSATLDIGFTFNFDEVNYTKIYVNTNGWACLIDPDNGFILTDVLSGNEYANDTIKEKFEKPSGGPAKHTLLAPWFDRLQSIYRNVIDAAAILGSSNLEKINSGKMLTPGIVNSSTGGLKFYRGKEFQDGRCLVIRWNTFTYLGSSTRESVLFDLVIYENGKIEFRYAPVNFTNETLGDATVGIFGYGGVPGPLGTDFPRYRDFGYVIKNDPTDMRKIYKNGATADQPFSSYVTDLKINNDWPASPGGTMGAIFHFSPPVSHRRIIRRDVTSLETKTSIGNFDDRKTIVYGQTETVSYPVGLPASHVIRTGHHGASNFQNLLGSSSLEFDRAVLPSTFDSFLVDKPEYESDSFTEVKQHEQGQSAVPFFAKGSDESVGEPGSLSSPLANKTILRLELPVKNAVKMLPTTSSIYYYNKTNKQWALPQNAVIDMCDPFEKFAFNTLGDPSNFGSTPQGYTPGSAVFEDYKGFDPYGRAVASGSLNIFRQVDVSSTPNDRNQTIDNIGYVNQNNADAVDAMADYYSKSLQSSGLYTASFDEYFTLPIDKQFLLEKATFELPLAMGNSWFQDRTATVRTLHSGTSAGGSTYFVHFAYDRGGPALTVALFCQKNLGKSSVLDLIMTGTITHVDDSVRRVDFRKTPYLNDYDYIHAVSVGLPSANTVIIPDKEAPPSLQSFFTGTVVVNTEAAVSNGVSSALLNAVSVIRASQADPAQGLYSPIDAVDLIETRLSSSNFSYDMGVTNTDGESISTILGIDPFGRGMSGFAPSGGSIFGREFTTYKGNLSKDTIQNPFFVSDQTSRQADATKFDNELTDLLSTKYPGSPPYPMGRLASIVSIADLDFSSTRPSPYMLNPGDKLILAISKTRPAISESKFTINHAAQADIGRASVINSYSYFTGSAEGHDVLLNTGSINISFYGSYVRNGGSIT